MKDFIRGAGFCALANLMLMLPIVVLYFVLVRYMINGMAAGAVKE